MRRVFSSTLFAPQPGSPSFANSVAAARAWAMAEAKGRTLKLGETARRPSSSKVDEDEPILDPRKHFALMFGISPDYAAVG